MIEALYHSTFSAMPAASARIPGRVNLIGEHTDYNGGLVLPTPVPRSTQVAIGPNLADTDEVWSERFQESVTVSLDQPKRDHWADYAVGALQAARAAGWITGGQRLVVASDIPDGAGLSSSAALIVSILTSAARSSNVDASVRVVARLAQSVERDYVGMPCGIMDQMAVTGGLLGQAMRLDTRTLMFDLFALPNDWHISVINSGVRRALAEGRYAKRRHECEQAATALGATWLCHLSDTQQRSIANLPPPLDRRARHARSDHERVDCAIEAIKAQDLVKFGCILLDGHASLRDEFEVSLPEIDQLVDLCVSEGASGARLTGGGFGGCVVAAMPKADHAEWRTSMLRAQSSLDIIC